MNIMQKKHFENSSCPGMRPVKLMGILNVTPDSFSDGGKYFGRDQALKHAEKLISEGADIIDVGGESSKAGSRPIPVQEEIKRIIPVISEIKKRFKVAVSVDTYKKDVAESAVNEGAEIINDITGLSYEGGIMAEFAAEKRLKTIIMHMKGMPENMQLNPCYEDVVREISEFFAERIRFVVSKGIKKENIIIDPGIGFGKTLEHNLTILRNLSAFLEFKVPLMVGPSRKSFIGDILNADVSQRLEGTLAASVYAAMQGVSYIRIHDVGEVKKALDVLLAITGNV